MVVVVAVADAGAAGFPVAVFAVAELSPRGAPGRRRGAFFVAPLVIVVVDKNCLFPRYSILSCSSGRESPTSAEVVVEGGVDQFNRAAVFASHRPRKFAAVFHLINHSVLPVPQNQPLPIVSQAAAVRAKRCY